MPVDPISDEARYIRITLPTGVRDLHHEGRIELVLQDGYIRGQGPRLNLYECNARLQPYRWRGKLRIDLENFELQRVAADGEAIRVSGAVVATESKSFEHKEQLFESVRQRCDGPKRIQGAD